MRRGFTFLSRVAIWGAAAALIAATLLGRSGRHPPVHRPTFPREPASPRYHAFDGSLFRGHGCEPRLLDTETGRLGALELPGAGTFDKLSFSPWRDAAGQSRVVGRWKEGAAEGLLRLPGPSGIAWWTYPEGRLVGRIETGLLPVSPPCWPPDRSDRVVFAGGDGRLYLLDLRDGGELDGELTGPRPRVIRWANPPAVAEVFMIRDPCWPPAAALDGCLLASVCWREPDAEPGSLAHSHLWWLRLGADGTEIVASGRLIVPEEGEPEPGEDEYAPGVGMTSEGVALLAYLAGPRGKIPTELRVAPIMPVSGPWRGAPRVEAGSARLAAAKAPLALMAPTFSSDGRWIYTSVRSPGGFGVTIERIAVAPDGRHEAPVRLGAASRSGAIGWSGG